MPLTRIKQRSPAAVANDEIKALSSAMELLPAPEDAERFGRAFDRYGEASVVLLGESTHGSSEFYRARAAITRRLIEEHGFTVVAVEADWPDAGRIDRYVRHREPPRTREEAFARFPTWMWRNVEVRDFADWLRDHNERLEPERRVEFRGLDVYSLSGSIVAVLDYLGDVDPESAQEARRRYGCLTPWQSDPPLYGRAVLAGEDPCEEPVIVQLHALLERRLEYIVRDGEAFFDAAQNARIVRAAERYYRVMYRGSTESWNLRDRHMFETLQQILERRGAGTKAVVWAHNSHVGNAAATAMGWSGEFNIGELCRTAYGNDAVLLGFGTDRGTVAAASNWDEPMTVKTVLPAREDSYEHLFHRTGFACALTDWSPPDRGGLRQLLAIPRLERAIGVVYRPETEYLSHYFDAVLPEQFEGFVWFDETKAVTPLPARRPQGVPETYPFGL